MVVGGLYSVVAIASDGLDSCMEQRRKDLWIGSRVIPVSECGVGEHLAGSMHGIPLMLMGEVD